MYGIWKYSSYFEQKIQVTYRLTLNEGSTPLELSEKISEKLNCKVYFKREDLNPSGSHKDRNTALQISFHNQNNDKELVISSSGNNAISAINYIKLTDLRLVVFLPNKLSPSKKYRIKKVIEKLKDPNQVNLIYSDTAKSEAFRYAKENNIPNLIPSEDPIALQGASTLGIELAESTINSDAIFIPTSSGTGFMGISNGYQLKNIKPPEIHAVQTSKVHPISVKFDKDFNEERNTLAKAIVAKVTVRENEVVKNIKESNGWAWTMNNKEIRDAQILLHDSGIDTSYDSALSLAGLIKAQQNRKEYKTVICILTGK